ncbi:hypothetical protein NliqN6_4802 [Naganishia liquefaciens]|uniref:Cullin family profile domain-containing protein n=1 Tax=Naganishia liquefaciens TaxID=104408 RepID=A0A8H3TWA5_9TREE|nr:hypothetical protein NliqN6_4802 [Naganishia liquefaciens]
MLQEYGMLVSDEEDEEMISPAEYGYQAEDTLRPPTEIVPELSDTGWIQRERAMGKAYSTMAAYLSPRNIRISGKQKAPNAEVIDALQTCVLHTRADQIASLLADFLQEVSVMFHLVINDIEQHFASVDSEFGDAEAYNIARMMSNLFDTLILWQSGWNRPLKHIELFLIDHKENFSQKAGRPIPIYNLCNTYIGHFQGLLHSYTRSSKFHRYLNIYFRATLPPLEKVKYGSADREPADDRLHLAVLKPHKELHRLGYLPKYSSMLVDLAYERIERLVKGETDLEIDVTMAEEEQQEEELSSWSRPMLATLRKEVQRQVVTWLYTYINGGNERDYQRKANIDARIDYALQSALFEHRVKELFPIIVDFPESRPGLEDIRDCSAIHKPIKRARMIEEMGSSIRKRLLHPGAETRDIITHYVSTIRAVKIIDSSGILLYAITGPIQEYLKKRKDTISCIVSMLVDGNDLTEAGEDQPDKIKPIQVQHEQAEDWSNPNWDPEPIDAAPEFKSQKASDIISTLVGMYDSREIIVIELQQWLAKRLLVAHDYDIDAEIMEIEKLKLRFGDAALHVCDIMLKDLSDSKRTNNRVQSDHILPVKPKILSHLYWPAIKEPKFRLPKKLQKIQNQYGDAYHRFRQDKKLKFYRQGTVAVEVQLQDRRLNLEVTLLQAAVLEAFAKRDRMTLATLTKRLRHKDQAQVQHAVDHWINAGVFRSDSEGLIVLQEVSADGGTEQDAGENMPVEDAIDLESVEDIQQDLHEKHWPEIQGLLAAKYELSTEQIHAALSCLPSYSESRNNLERFLGAVTRNGLVECVGLDRWRLAEQLE